MKYLFRKMKYLLFFILVLSFGFQKVSAISTTVVINEIMVDPGTGEVEWIELFNNTDSAITLDKYSIEDNTEKPKDLSLCTIDAGSYLVLEKGAGDCKFSFTLNNDGDIIKLSKEDSVIDKVVYGKLSGNAPIPAQGESIARIPNGHDTDDDATNFIIEDEPTPGTENPTPPKNNPPSVPELILPENNSELIDKEVSFSWSASTDLDLDEISYSLYVGCSNSFTEEELVESGQIETSYQYELTKTCDNYYWQIITSDGKTETLSEVFSFIIINPEPLIYSSKIFINELMPDPSGDDTTNEWVELYNDSGESVNLKDWSLEDTSGAVKKYYLSDMEISAFGFLVLRRNETGITLNNNADGIRLYQPDGNLIHETSIFASAKQDFSWARTNSGDWSWTTKVTAGLQNIIELPSADLGGTDEEIPVINKIPIKIKTKSYKSYENKLVQIEGEVTETSGRTFYLNDGSGKVKVYIQAQTEIIKPPMHKGDIFKIIGVVNLYRNTWRILPRAQEDIILVKEKTQTQTQAQAKAKKPATKTKAVASKTMEKSPEQPRAPTSDSFIKQVKAATNQEQESNVAGYIPLWLQVTKLITGLAIVFVVLLVLKVKSMPGVKIVGGRFGEDDT